MNRIILVICEGNSEKAYLQELNRFLRESEIPLIFNATVSEGGDYHFVNSCFRRCKKNNKKAHIVIWVDRDIYKRNDRGNHDAYERKPKGIPDFKFNIENFEDFLVLHLADDQVALWQSICNKKGHFTKPLYAKLYEPCLRADIFSNYKKGALPSCLTINSETLDNLKRHNNNSSISFRSDFADFIILEIKNAQERNRQTSR